MKEVIIHGISMEPLLHEGDIILIEAAEHYNIGDILAFDYGKQGILIHRLIDRLGELYVCRGDNAISKEIIGKKRILGKTAMTTEGKPYKVMSKIEE